MRPKLSFENHGSKISGDCKDSLEILKRINTENIDAPKGEHQQEKHHSKPRRNCTIPNPLTSNSQTLEDIFQDELCPKIEMCPQKTRARDTKSLKQIYQEATRPANDSSNFKYGTHKENTLSPFGVKLQIETTFPSIVKRELTQPKPSPQKKVKNNKTLCKIFDNPSRTEAPTNSSKRALNDRPCTESPVKVPGGQLSSASPLSVLSQSRLGKPFPPIPENYRRDTERKFPLITENYKRIKEQRKNSDKINPNIESLEIKAKRPKIEEEITSSLDEIIPSKENEQSHQLPEKVKPKRPKTEEEITSSLDEIIPSKKKESPPQFPDVKPKKHKIEGETTSPLDEIIPSNKNDQFLQLPEKVKPKRPRIEEETTSSLDEIIYSKNKEQFHQLPEKVKPKRPRIEEETISSLGKMVTPKRNENNPGDLISQSTQKILAEEREDKSDNLGSRYSLRSSSSSQSFCMLDSVRKPRKKRIGFADGCGTESNPLDLDESSQHTLGNTPEKDKTDTDKHNSSDNQAEISKKSTNENDPTNTHKDSSSNDKKESLSSTDVLKYPPDSQRCITLTKEDLEFLRPDTYINDSIVEFYMLYLGHEVVPKGEREDYYFFSPFFFSRLKDVNVKDLNRLERWTKDLCIQKRKFLIMPIHMPEHWCLSIICLQKGVFKGMEDKQCILYFDSLGPLAETRTERKIRRWVEYELLKSEGRANEFKINEQSCFSREEVPFFSLDLPLQQNFTDCGLFILHYAELFITKRPESITDFRMWFDPSDTRTKRKDILKLIKRLSSPKDNENENDSEDEDEDEDEIEDESEDEDKRGNERETDSDDIEEKSEDEGESEKEDKITKKKKTKKEKDKQDKKEKEKEEKDNEIDRIKASQTEEYDDFGISSNSVSKIPSDVTDIPSSASSSSSSSSSNRATQSQDILASETSSENI